jgi:branched-chain amino acid transport system permease protein
MNATTQRWRWLIVGVAGLVALGLGPLFVGEFWHFFLAEMAILTLLAISFNLVYGYGGMLSFCQGTFYGVGAYVVAWLALRGGLHPAVVVVAAVAVSGLVALATGLIFVRMGGHNFTVATVILAVVGFLAGNTLRPITGGEDGLSFSLLAVSMRTKLYLALAVLVVCLAALARLARSVVGKIVIGVRENEVRARFLGYNARALRLVVFTVGGALAGLSGALYAMTTGYVSTQVLEIGLSVNAILWSVVGGVGTVIGPVIGVAVLLWLTEYLSSLIVYSQIPVGILLILVVTFTPDGIIGRIGKVWAERR